MTKHDLIDAIYSIPDSPEAWLEMLHHFTTAVENTEQDVEEHIYQHLNRSIQLGIQINELESQLHSHKKTFDMIQMPAVILNEAGDIIEINNATKKLLEDDPLFQADKNKILFSELSNQEKFISLISQASKQKGRQALSFRTNQKNAITLGLVAISQGHAKRYLLMINGGKIQSIPASANISHALGLTPKEGDITRMIAEGKSLQAIADISFNSYETIRTHLKRIFVKTGCGSQIELAYKVYSCCLPDMGSQTADANLLPVEDACIQLNDGRTLSYCTYGPEDGFPLVLHHTIEGSRKQVPIQLQMLFEYGIRIIIADRPGYGQSTYVNSRTLHDWPNDLEELLKHLGIERFSLMGKQFGAEYALVCAQYFNDRVVSTHLVSMSTPPEVIQDATDNFSFTRAAVILARKAPKVLGKVIYFASRKYQHRPRDFMKQVMMFQSEKDYALLDDATFVDHSFSAWLEGSEPTQCLMAVKELQIISSPWNIDFETITSPVHIWHSRNDPQASYAAVKKLLPYFSNVHQHISEDDSVITYLHRWEDILEQVQPDGCAKSSPSPLASCCDANR